MEVIQSTSANSQPSTQIVNTDSIVSLHTSNQIAIKEIQESISEMKSQITEFSDSLLPEIEKKESNLKEQIKKIKDDHINMVTLLTQVSGEIEKCNTDLRKVIYQNQQSTITPVEVIHHTNDTPAQRLSTALITRLENTQDISSGDLLRTIIKIIKEE